MAFNFEQDSIKNYVAENKDIILKDIVFGTYGDTIQLMTKQLGVKTSEKIHPSHLEVVLQDGKECGFTSQGGLTFSERTINTEVKKVNMDFCPEQLLNTFAEYSVRVAANPDALPFEAEVIEGVAKSINKQVEEGVWGQLLNADGINGTSTEKKDAYEIIMDAYMALDERVLEDAILFVRPSLFRAYIKALVDKNLYHYNPADGDLQEIFIPGAGVKVRKAKGITTNDVFGTSPRNMIYGTDFLENKEEIKFWFSDDDDVYKLKSRFNYGAQVAFPDLVTKITYQG